jgi:hypothetical protein
VERRRRVTETVSGSSEAPSEKNLLALIERLSFVRAFDLSCSSPRAAAEKRLTIARLILNQVTDFFDLKLT